MPNVKITDGLLDRMAEAIYLAVPYYDYLTGDHVPWSNVRRVDRERHKYYSQAAAAGAAINSYEGI